MKLNSKCEFNVGSIEILGHVVDHKGLSPNPDLVRAINEAPTPTNRDQVKSFLGLVVEYKPGIENKVADALSRLPVEHNPAIGVVDDDDDDIAAVCQTVLQESSVTYTQLQSETNRDEACQTLKGYIQQGWPQSKSGVDDKVKPYYSVHDELSVHDNIIFRGEKVVVPTGLTSIIVSMAHEGHQGMVRTKQRIRKLYWWPGMDNQVTTMVKHCATCNLADKSVSTRVAPMQPVPLQNVVGTNWDWTLVGPDETAPLGCRFAITLIDYKSKWPEVAFTDTVTSSTVIEFLLTVFSREGYPKEIVTDHGVQFTSHEFKEFLRSRNIVHRMSAIYHPQGNIDQIYHLACPASPPHYMYNPIKTIKTSSIGTLNMLGLARRVKARLILASTSEVYGDPQEHPQNEEYWGHVNPIGPRACYDEGKRVAETMCHAYIA
ncbi:hypothetical protein BSL78_07543, partial [Apostichopus japonicus]